MNCEPLAATGLTTDLGLILCLAVTCLVGGAIILILARSSSGKGMRATAALILILVGGVAVTVFPVPAAHAASADCSAADNSLAITQTSILDAIAPGIAPRAITGMVVNRGVDSTHISEVVVAITAVTTGAGAPLDGCDATDFTLSNPRMSVGRTIAPHASTTFSGASIGFSNKSINQDACKGAVIHLLFTANPG